MSKPVIIDNKLNDIEKYLTFYIVLGKFTDNCIILPKSRKSIKIYTSEAELYEYLLTGEIKSRDNIYISFMPELGHHIINNKYGKFEINMSDGYDISKVYFYNFNGTISENIAGSMEQTSDMTARPTTEDKIHFHEYERYLNARNKFLKNMYEDKLQDIDYGKYKTPYAIEDEVAKQIAINNLSNKIAYQMGTSGLIESFNLNEYTECSVKQFLNALLENGLGTKYTEIDFINERMCNPLDRSEKITLFRKYTESDNGIAKLEEQLFSVQKMYKKDNEWYIGSIQDDLDFTEDYGSCLYKTVEVNSDYSNFVFITDFDIKFKLDILNVYNNVKFNDNYEADKPSIEYKIRGITLV